MKNPQTRQKIDGRNEVLQVEVGDPSPVATLPPGHLRRCPINTVGRI
jgi:hypothetical protein